MPDSRELSRELVQKLDALVDQIAAAREFSEDVRRELRGHLEDKAGAFLSGDERLNDADILLLVERHFGEKEQLRQLLREGGAPDVQPIANIAPITGIFFRRLGTVIVAAVIVTFIWQMCDLVPFTASGSWQGSLDRRLAYAIYWLMLAGIPAINTLVLVSLLIWWSGRRNEKSSPWFIRLPPRRLTAIVLSAVAVRWIIPAVWIGPTVLPRFRYDWWEMTSMSNVAALIRAFAFIWVLLWIIWRGRRVPRTRLAIWDGYIAFLIFLCVVPLLRPIWQIAQAPETPARFTSAVVPGTHHFVLQFGLAPVRGVFFPSPLGASLIGLVIVGVYFVIAHWTPKLTRRLQHA